MANGVLALPDQTGPYRHELIAAGKGTTVYVLNRDDMGKLCTSCTTGDTQIVQEFDLGGYGTGAPAYWNGRVYFTPGFGSSTAQAYAVSDGLLNFAARSPLIAGGGHPFVTSNGDKNGILWTPGPRSVFALDAVTLQILYTTNQAKNGRDVPPPLVHFPMPIVAKGKLYLRDNPKLDCLRLATSKTRLRFILRLKLKSKLSRVLSQIAKLLLPAPALQQLPATRG